MTSNGLSLKACSPSSGFKINGLLLEPLIPAIASPLSSNFSMTQGILPSEAARGWTETSVTLSEAIRTLSESVAHSISTQAGVKPSTTDKFGLSELGGHEEPGQCQTRVFLPASAKTFHNCSALQLRLSRL